MSISLGIPYFHIFKIENNSVEVLRILWSFIEADELVDKNNSLLSFSFINKLIFARKFDWEKLQHKSAHLITAYFELSWFRTHNFEQFNSLKFALLSCSVLRISNLNNSNIRRFEWSAMYSEILQKFSEIFNKGFFFFRNIFFKFPIFSNSRTLSNHFVFNAHTDNAHTDNTHTDNTHTDDNDVHMLFI